MAEITAKLVQQLRQRTHQSMMECKKALQETGGDLDAAVDVLRKKGLASSEKKSARTTKEGLVAVAEACACCGGGAAMVEVVCETDFCARNEHFQAMVVKVAELAAQAKPGPIEATPEITAAVQGCFNKIGENMKYGRGVKIQAPVIGKYIHHNRKVGVVVGLDRPLDPQILADLCMHIAFADPMAIAPDQIPPELVERERRIAQEQAAASGKPPQIVEKMVQGKVNKFLSENALLEQPFVRDDKKKVKDILGGAQVLAFARFAIGQ